MDYPRPLIEHLIELRRRLFYCAALFLVVFAVCYGYSDCLFQMVVKPLADVFYLQGKSGHRLIYTGLSEAFTTYLKVSGFCAFIIIFPFTAMQAWLFMAPGLYKKERHLFSIILILTPVLFLVGAAFAYFVVFPMAYNFFLSFETAGSDIIPAIQLEARMGEYLSFVMRLILAFGICFELPIVLMLLVRTRLMTREQLVQNWRIAILIIFTLAAIITPPDIFSMLGLAIPLTILYGLSIWLVKDKK